MVQYALATDQSDALHGVSHARSLRIGDFLAECCFIHLFGNA